MPVVIWYIIVFIAALVVSNMLIAKPKTERQRPAGLEDLSYPHANEGDPYPLILGRAKLKSMNVLNYFDFQAKAFKRHDQFAGYNYLIGASFGLACGGPLTLRRIWIGDKTLWQGVSTNDPAGQTFTFHDTEFLGGINSAGGISGDITYYPGTFNQAVDPYEDSRTDGGVPNYGGLAHITLGSITTPYFWMGNSANIDPWWFELEFHPNNLSLDAGPSWNGIDLNPMEMVYYLLTNGWACIGADASGIDVAAFRAAGNILNTENNGMSLIVDSSNSGNDVITEVVRQARCVFYVEPSTDLLTVKLLRKVTDLTTLVTLDESDVTSVSQFSQKLWPDTFNQVRVKYKDRSKNYADAVATAQDFANINYQGKIRSTEYSVPTCYDNALAGDLAAVFLGQVNVIVMQAQLTCTRRKASALRPGDCFLWSFPKYNIVNALMRVGKYDDGNLNDGKIVMLCTQDTTTDINVLTSQPDSTSTSPSDRSAQVITQFAISEAPFFLARRFGTTADSSWGSDSTAFLGLASRPAASTYGIGFRLSTSLASLNDDAQTYTPSGTLTVAYAASTGGAIGYDTTVGIKLTGLTDSSILRTNSDDDIRAGLGIIKINDEYIGYSAFSASGSVYTLTGIRRGLFGSPIQDHVLAAVVWFLNRDEGISQYPVQLSANPQPVDVYPLDATDQGSHSLSGQTSKTVVCIHETYGPLPPDYLRLSQPDSSNKKLLQLDWANREPLSTNAALFNDGSQSFQRPTTTTIVGYFNGSSTATSLISASTTDTGQSDQSSNASILAGSNSVIIVATTTCLGYTRSRQVTLNFTV